MTHQKRDRLSYAVGCLYKAVIYAPDGFEMIQAKKRELINRGVIMEGGTNGRNKNNQPADSARSSA